MNFQVIVVGAGAAGLMAAHELSKAGCSVCIIEASENAGGRIATIAEDGFSAPVETGAEFIHGDLAMTFSLLQKAGIVAQAVEGEMVRIINGRLDKHHAHDPHWDEFMHALGKQKNDCSLADFLAAHFSAPKYELLRNGVQQFAEGFDLADISRSSALAALHEWANEEDNQYRIPRGYVQLISFLLAECQKAGVKIIYNSPVTRVQYNKKAVTVQTGNGSHTAAAAVVTVSAGILQSGDIVFEPAFPQGYGDAIRSLGFGHVIKWLFEFTSPVWKKKAGDAGFLLSDEEVPTWWTQLPDDRNLLTGWLGGPKADKLSALDDQTLLEKGIQSLARILGEEALMLHRELTHYRVIRWKDHPFVKGGYSYVTTGTAAARKILMHPLDTTVYFAGEAMYRGQSQGTVEAALQSGAEAARLIQLKFV